MLISREQEYLLTTIMLYFIHTKIQQFCRKEKNTKCPLFIKTRFSAFKYCKTITFCGTFIFVDCSEQQNDGCNCQRKYVQLMNMCTIMYTKNKIWNTCKNTNDYKTTKFYANESALFHSILDEVYILNIILNTYSNIFRIC